MNLQDFATLVEAKAYTTTQPKLIHRDSMNSLLASAGMYIALKDVAADTASPYQNLMAAFLDSVEYNFMIGNATGDRQIGALDSIIASGGALGLGLAAIRPTILAMANPEVKPFENATEHAFQVAKGAIENNLAPITAENGYARITVSADVEAHNPQIRQKLTFADNSVIYKRVAGFSAVSLAGDYQAQCPNLTDLFVDNAYGVVA